MVQFVFYANSEIWHANFVKFGKLLKMIYLETRKMSQRGENPNPVTGTSSPAGESLLVVAGLFSRIGESFPAVTGSFSRTGESLPAVTGWFSPTGEQKLAKPISK
jgi:hypothetical protein